MNYYGLINVLNFKNLLIQLSFIMINFLSFLGLKIITILITIIIFIKLRGRFFT